MKALVRPAKAGPYVLLMCVTAACARETPPDAYGNVEAIEVVVSAEASGRLVTFTVDEGQVLGANASIGWQNPTPC